MNKLINLLREFCYREEGQALAEYGGTLAWIVVTFLIFVVLALGVQTGVINIISDAMCSGMQSMASKTVNNTY